MVAAAACMILWGVLPSLTRTIRKWTGKTVDLPGRLVRGRAARYRAEDVGFGNQDPLEGKEEDVRVIERESGDGAPRGQVHRVCSTVESSTALRVGNAEPSVSLITTPTIEQA